MRRAALVLLPALAACGPQSGADGYTFEQAEFERSSLQIEVVQYDTRAAFEAAAKAKGIDDPSKLAAFASYHPAFPTCTIHTQRIATNYAPEFLGHELTHCVHGRFHKDDGR